MSTPQEFIDFLIPLTKQKIVLQSLLISQICLESQYGKKHFYNNYLGIKKHGNCKSMPGKTKEFVNGDYKSYRLDFCIYDSISDCISDYLSIMSKARYEPVRSSQNYIEATEQIRLCGYATSPNYSINLRKIIERYNLMELDKDIQLTENFNLREFYCKGERPPEELIPNIQRVADNLQMIRNYFGKPIHINSGWRCEKHNSQLDNASKKSFHLSGLASDIRMSGISPLTIYKWAKQNTAFKGFGIGNTYLHVDLRPVKNPIVWVY